MLKHNSADDFYSGGINWFQVLLRNSQIEVLVVPSVTRPSIHQAVSIGEHLADNSWHSVIVHFQGGYVLSYSSENQIAYKWFTIVL